MNIFKNEEDFIGSFIGIDEGNSLDSIFQLASQIRSKLRKHGYLLDHYMSVFFKSVNNTLAQSASENGFDAAGKYQSYCADIIRKTNDCKEHPLYLKTIQNCMTLNVYHYLEEYTKINLIYVAMADDFYEEAVKLFIREQHTKLSGPLDAIELVQIYEQISDIVGEHLMETFTLKLKQKFLIVPSVLAFTQGFMNNLIERLVSRDRETDKRIFQLILDTPEL